MTEPRVPEASTPTELPPAHLSDLVMEVRIEASTEAVWQALTEGIGAWWPAEFYTGGEPTSRDFVLEAWPGGRMYEQWGGDAGLLWATVYTVDPGKLLQVSGLGFPEWGGPSLWLGTWRLEADGEATRLRFQESALGKTDPHYVAEKDKGWSYLFAGALKAHLEATEPPAWDDWTSPHSPRSTTE